MTGICVVAVQLRPHHASVAGTLLAPSICSALNIPE